MDPQFITLREVLLDDVVKEKFLLATEIDIMCETLDNFPDELWQTIKNCYHNPNIRIILPNILIPATKNRAEKHGYSLNKIVKYYQQVLDLAGGKSNISIKISNTPMSHIYIRLNGGSIVGVYMNHISDSDIPIHGLSHHCKEFHIYCKEFLQNWKDAQPMNYSIYRYIQEAISNENDNYHGIENKTTIINN